MGKLKSKLPLISGFIDVPLNTIGYIISCKSFDKKVSPSAGLIGSKIYLSSLNLGGWPFEFESLTGRRSLSTGYLVVVCFHSLRMITLTKF